MIHTYIPYAPKSKEFNLGWVYNNFMEMVNDNDWVLFLDHDATFTTRNWYYQISDIINNNPEYGVFTGVTNRIGNSSIQRVETVNPDTHDMKYHRQIGQQLLDQYGHRVESYDTHFLSGVIILISKKTWENVGGFKEGFLGVDNCLHKACRNKNIPVGLAKGLYVYHWYRGDGDQNHLKAANNLHKNPFY